ncbi:hypothetical protein V1264_008955 [Littorina saxatilis]|uniref:Cadherin domain-containing protein n=1 Tax=Littorina saxatilis TaxID=31220 RepID=A0AAN9AQC6_9CAEN
MSYLQPDFSHGGDNEAAQSSNTTSDLNGSGEGQLTTTVTNTENIKAGDTVYKVGCPDHNNDSVQYALITEPVSELFRIDTGGMIRASRDLKPLCASSINFKVTCKDPKDSTVRRVSVKATLDGANRQPTITGINFNTDVAENTTVGTTLATFSVTDDDSNISCRLTSTPAESTQYFGLDHTQRSIIVKSKLNYEQPQTRHTNVTVTCSDGFCASNLAYVYIRVTDVNESTDNATGRGGEGDGGRGLDGEGGREGGNRTANTTVVTTTERMEEGHSEGGGEVEGRGGREGESERERAGLKPLQKKTGGKRERQKERKAARQARKDKKKEKRRERKQKRKNKERKTNTEGE